MVLKVSPCYIYTIYITVLGWTDFDHPIFSIISSQSSFIEVDLLKNVSVVETQNKCYIFKISEQSLQVADLNNSLGVKMSGT